VPDCVAVPNAPYLGNTPIMIGGDLIVAIDGEKVESQQTLARRYGDFHVSPARCRFMTWARVCWLSTFSPSIATIRISADHDGSIAEVGAFGTATQSGTVGGSSLYGLNIRSP